MNYYENLYRSTADDSKADDVFCSLKNYEQMGWEDIYWAAKYLYEKAPGRPSDEPLWESLDYAMHTGLDIGKGRDLYIDAAKMAAQLLFRYGKYRKATNYLQNLINNQKEGEILPDWVHQYYAISQIHERATLKVILKKPERLDQRINEIQNSKDSFQLKRAIFSELLKVGADYLSSLPNTIDLDYEHIHNEAKDYKLLHTEQWNDFAQAVNQNQGADVLPLYEIEEEYEQSEDNSELCGALERNKELTEENQKLRIMLDDLKAKLGDLQSSYEKDTALLNEKVKNLVFAVNSKNAEIIAERDRVRTLVADFEKIKDEESSKLQENNASFELEKAQLEGQLSEKDAQINELKESLDSKSEDLAGKDAAINQAKLRIADLQESLNTVRNDLQVQQKKYDDLLAGDTKNKTNTAPVKLLQEDQWHGDAHNLITRFHDRAVIYVVGAAQLKPNDMQGIAKKFGLKKDDINFFNDYEKLTNDPGFNMQSPRIVGVLVGPMPHSITGKGNESSFIEKLKKQLNDNVIEMRSNDQGLKITKTSFTNALSELMYHLQAIAIDESVN